MIRWLHDAWTGDVAERLVEIPPYVKLAPEEDLAFAADRRAEKLDRALTLLGDKYVLKRH